MCIYAQLQHQEVEDDFNTMIQNIHQARYLELGSCSPNLVQPLNGGQMPRGCLDTSFIPDPANSFEAIEAQHRIWSPDYVHQSEPWPIEYSESSSVQPKKRSKSTYMHVALRKSCTFCPGFGATLLFSRSHRIRSLDGKVTCPVLRAYNCRLCNNGGGDDAHTEGFCPLNPNPKKPTMVHKVRLAPRRFQ